jgi:hypothetical protein
LKYLFEEILKIEKMQIQKYKDLTAVAKTVKKYVYGEHVDEEDKRLISQAEKMGLLPIVNKIDEAIAHSKNLKKLLDKLRKLPKKSN